MFERGNWERWVNRQLSGGMHIQFASRPRTPSPAHQTHKPTKDWAHRKNCSSQISNILETLSSFWLTVFFFFPSFFFLFQWNSSPATYWRESHLYPVPGTMSSGFPALPPEYSVIWLNHNGPGKQNRIYEPTTKPCPHVTGNPQGVVINVTCQPKAQAQVRPHTFLKTIRKKPIQLTHCLHYLWIRPLKQHWTQEITIIPVAASWEQVNSSLHGLKA